MNDKIIGLRFDTALPPEQCSPSMAELFRRLFADAHITYDQILFPYADSLLLSDWGAKNAFGTHALLWDVDPKLLADCAVRACGDRLAELRPRAKELDCTAAAIAEFLSMTYDVSGDPGERETAGQGRSDADGYMPLGDFAALMSGSVRPWSIREQARRFCSLAEHIARLPDASIHGIRGGSLLVSGGDRAELLRLYSAKTGGRAG